MTNSAPLSISSVAAKRPLSLLHRPPIPFNMVNTPPSLLQASASASSSRSLHSFPNWARLTDADDDGNAAENVDVVLVDADAANADSAGVASDDQDADDAANSNNAAANNETSDSGDHHHRLAPTYSTSHGASAAYQAGLLKSDLNISSNHPSIRLAFRYIVEQEQESEEGGLKRDDDGREEHDDDESGDLFLCWVRQDGIPCHFRRMHPVRNKNSNNSTEAEVEGEGQIQQDDSNNQIVEGMHGNLRGSSIIEVKRPSAEVPAMMLVNENDHIETTYPGHAFVFCRRVPYNHDHNNNTETEGNETQPVVVVNDDNGNTYFMRKRKCRQQGEEETKGSKSEEEDDDDDDEWEEFLVVGGFRPGPMPELMDDEDTNSEVGENGGEIMDDHEEGKEEGKAEESSSDSDSEDDSSCGREHSVQLVTIRSSKISNRTNTELETEEDDDVDLPSKVMGCSDCTQSVPFLRGAMNPKPRHTPAFVATKNDAKDEALLELPPRDENQTTAATGYTIYVTVRTTQLDRTPIDTSSKHYDEVILGGWPCRTEPGCFPPDMDVPENNGIINLLRARFEADLLAASQSLPPHAREKLLASTPVWINKSQSFGPKVAPIKARDGCFHPGSEWLVRNGMNPAKCGGVEWYDARHYLSDCDLWGAGGLMLHELSHAWHCLHIEDGYDNEEIINVYRRAMEDGLYECVRVRGPQGPECKAYACQDQMEYFAELSVAFLGGLDDDREHNKWYPFNRRQLREHDPRAFAMLCRMWDVDDDTLRDEDETSEQVDSSGEASKES